MTTRSMRTQRSIHPRPHRTHTRQKSIPYPPLTVLYQCTLHYIGNQLTNGRLTEPAAWPKDGRSLFIFLKASDRQTPCTTLGQMLFYGGDRYLFCVARSRDFQQNLSTFVFQVLNTRTNFTCCSFLLFITLLMFVRIFPIVFVLSSTSYVFFTLLIQKLESSYS